jgi:hypothetical protein
VSGLTAVFANTLFEFFYRGACNQALKFRVRTLLDFNQLLNARELCVQLNHPLSASLSGDDPTRCHSSVSIRPDGAGGFSDDESGGKVLNKVLGGYTTVEVAGRRSVCGAARNQEAP